MHAHDAYVERIERYVPAPWEEIPDLGLYMDQVITYLQRRALALYGEGDRALTPAMINNYVKYGLVDRPRGKKYDRVQLAQLLMLVTLKQAASLEDMKRMLDPGPDGSVEALYADFRRLQAETLRETLGQLADATPMACAVRASAMRGLCEELLRAPAAEPEA